MSLQSVFPAIELTLTREFFSLFQQLSLMTAAQNTVYVVLTFAIRKADLSFLPYSKLSIYEIVSVLHFYSSAH